MESANDRQKPWLTDDFEEQFRAAFGRDMTVDERRYFGLEDAGEESPGPLEE